MGSIAVRAINLGIDSLIQNVMTSAAQYGKMTESFDAEMYLRTNIKTLKKNFLYPYTYLIPNFVLYNSEADDGIIEVSGSQHFRAPNNYEYKIKYVNGDITSRKKMVAIPFNLLNVNVYDLMIGSDGFLLPLRMEAKKYYDYRLAETFSENGKRYYVIRYHPLYSSAKMLKGSFTIEENTWRITHFFCMGRDLFVDFSLHIDMGSREETMFLPVKFEIYRSHSYLGNKIQNSYYAAVEYRNIIKKKPNDAGNDNYDVGNRYKLILDSVEVNKDTLFWSRHRIFPLKIGDKLLLDRLNNKQQNWQNDSAQTNNRAVELIGQSLIGNTKYWYKKTEINYSGFINPAMISYSTKEGLNYRMKLGLKFQLMGDKELSVGTSAGYIMRYKDLVADISTTFHYHPRRLGHLTLSVGKGNMAFSSLFIQEVQDTLMSQGLTFNDMFVNYYKDYYVRLFNSIEAINGLNMGTGIDYHIRKINPKKDENLVNDEILIRRHFVPTFRLVWTPFQYYRKEGFSKIYEKSDYPTFKIELAHSFKGILGGASVYDRFELDINQQISVGLLQSVQYHFGVGFYSRTGTEFFADYTFFARNSYPETWQDGIGGVFNMLSYNAYNASTSYAQAHIMYETPFLLFTMLPKLARGVLSERIYLSQLYTPYMKSYTEIGYGIGNKFVNAAVFGSFQNLQFQQIGGKVVFLLGK